MIVSETGMGKITAIKQCAKEVQQGVIYVSIPVNMHMFGDAFASALGWTLEEDQMSFTEKRFGPPGKVNHNEDKWYLLLSNLPFYSPT